MNKNDNKMSLIKVPEYAYQNAEERSSEIINFDNANQVFENTILEESLKSYVFNNFKIDYFISNLDYFKYRSELFNLNYLTINKLVIAIFRSEYNEKSIFISKKIFNSNLAPDILCFITNLNDEKVIFDGFISKKDLKDCLVVSSLHDYRINKSILKNISILELSLQELNSEFNFINQEVSKTNFFESLNSFEKVLDTKNIPEDFIYEIEYLPSENYYDLLSSEELSKYYLELQVKLNSVYKNRNIVSINPRGKLLAKLFLYNNSLDNKIKNIAAAKSGDKEQVTVFEFDIVNNTVKKINIEIDSNIFDEESSITLKGLEQYTGKPWLLFIDLSLKALETMSISNPEEIFLNWDNKDFLEKNSDIINRFCYRVGAKNENEVIDEDGYLDIKVDGIISSDMNLFLAVIV